MFQKDILDLFDTFKINNRDSFYRLPPGEKPYFLGRLYNAFVKNTELSLADLRSSGGVKLHYETSGDLTSRTPNLANKTFLKKTSFYSNRTFITFPFKEVRDRKQLRLLRNRPKHEWPSSHRTYRRMMYFGKITRGRRTPVGGRPGIVGKVYTIDSAAFDDLLTIFFQLKPAISAGIAQVIPSFPDTEKVFKNKGLGLISANFSLPDLKKQFYESGIESLSSDRASVGLSNLLLPHFTNVPFERLLEIREKEENMYWEFQRRLERLLFGASQIESETIILNYLKEVDVGIRELHRKFEDIEATYKRKNIYMLIKFLSVGLTMMAPIEPDVKKSIATIVGGISAFDYLAAKEDKAKAMCEIRNNQFYIPWLIFKSNSGTKRIT